MQRSICSAKLRNSTRDKIDLPGAMIVPLGSLDAALWGLDIGFCG
jgi:hypothetical protein